MRLIDADELSQMVKRLIELTPTVDPPKELVYSVTVTMDTDEVIGRLMERGWGPVEHGRWIKIGEIDKDGNQYYQCSKCGKGETHVPIIDVKYCWNCGARMDEVENDEID